MMHDTVHIFVGGLYLDYIDACYTIPVYDNIDISWIRAFAQVIEDHTQL